MMLAFIDLEERVPTSHPLRTIKRLADAALAFSTKMGSQPSALRASSWRSRCCSKPETRA
jgi:hypothetical protein